MTSIIRVTREFTFEMAHVLRNYDGPCRNVHGHSYRLFVTIAGTPIDNSDNPKNGMVIDFSELKNIVFGSIDLFFIDQLILIFFEVKSRSFSSIIIHEIFFI